MSLSAIVGPSHFHWRKTDTPFLYDQSFHHSIQLFKETLGMTDVTQTNVAEADLLKNLGPLAPLVGIWGGDKGVDIAPSKDGSKETRFRERMTFEPLGPVVNGPQVLYGLRYATMAWPLIQEQPFHEEVGYWLCDAERRQVMRCFVIPRGVVVNAGGTAEPHAQQFRMAAEAGSAIYGVLSNPFLEQTMKTVHYELEVTIHEGGQFSYVEDTQIQIPGRSELFHHTDQNTLTRR